METLSSSMALCEGNPYMNGEFPLWMASNAELWCSFVGSVNMLLNKQSRSWDMRHSIIDMGYTSKIIIFSQGLIS